MVGMQDVLCAPGMHVIFISLYYIYNERVWVRTGAGVYLFVLFRERTDSPESLEVRSGVEQRYLRSP